MQVDIWVVIGIVYLGLLILGGTVMTIKQRKFMPVIGIFFGSIVPFFIGMML